MGELWGFNVFLMCFDSPVLRNTHMPRWRHSLEGNMMVLKIAYVQIVQSTQFQQLLVDFLTFYMIF